MTDARLATYFKEYQTAFCKVLEILVVEDVFVEGVFFFLCIILIFLNKILIKFVFTKNKFIIIIKSDHYKPKLNLKKILVHLTYRLPR